MNQLVWLGVGIGISTVVANAPKSEKIKVKVEEAKAKVVSYLERDNHSLEGTTESIVKLQMEILQYNKGFSLGKTTDDRHSITTVANGKRLLMDELQGKPEAQINLALRAFEYGIDVADIVNTKNNDSADQQNFKRK